MKNGLHQSSSSAANLSLSSEGSQIESTLDGMRLNFQHLLLAHVSISSSLNVGLSHVRLSSVERYLRVCLQKIVPFYYLKNNETELEAIWEKSARVLCQFHSKSTSKNAQLTTPYSTLYLLNSTNREAKNCFCIGIKNFNNTIPGRKHQIKRIMAFFSSSQ